MNQAQEVEVACNVFLRWLEGLLGRREAAVVLQAMADHLKSAEDEKAAKDLPHN